MRIDRLARLVLLTVLLATAAGAEEPRAETTSRPYEGVTYVQLVREAPRPLRIHLLRIDLAGPGVEVEVTSEPGDEPRTVVARSVLRAAREEGYAICVNGGPFRPWPVLPGDPVVAEGPVVHAGEIVAEPEERRFALCFGKDGRASIRRPPLDGVREAVPGFDVPPCLVAGRISGPAGRPQPRTAAGVSRDGRTLVLLVADGRQPGVSEGLTLHEVAALLRDAGAHDGMNLDGGGSTTLVLADRKGEPRVANTPVGLRLPGTFRAVGTCLGIRARVRNPRSVVTEPPPPDEPPPARSPAEAATGDPAGAGGRTSTGGSVAIWMLGAAGLLLVVVIVLHGASRRRGTPGASGLVLLALAPALLAGRASADPAVPALRRVTLDTPVEVGRGDWTLYSNTARVEDLAFAENGRTLWLATQGGALRIDLETGSARKFTTFDGLPGNHVYGVEIDRSGRVWFATGSGAGVLDGDVWRRFTTGHGLGSDVLHDVAVDGRGDVWLAGYDDGSVTRLDPRTGETTVWRRDTVTEVSGGKRVVSPRDPAPPRWGIYQRRILADSRGRIWTGSYGGGIAIVDDDGGTWTYLSAATGELPGDGIHDIAEAADGSILVATTGGVARRDPASGRWSTVVRRGRVRVVLPVGERALWGSSFPIRAFGLLDGIPLAFPAGPFEAEVSAARVGPAGRPWFATWWGHGVVRHDDEGWVQLLPADARTLRGDEVTGVVVGPDGSIFAGCGHGGGVSRFDGSTWRWYGRDDGLTSDSVSALRPGPGGWPIAEQPWGDARRFDGETWVPCREEDPRGARPRIVLAVEPGGAVWRRHGSEPDAERPRSVGLQRMEGDTTTVYTRENGLAGNLVRQVHVAPDGIVWIATNGGLTRFDGERFTSFTTRDGLPDDRIEAVATSPEGDLWVGTWSGLVRREAGRWWTTTTVSGLASDVVLSIAFDGRGTAWIGTLGGLSRYRYGP